VSDTAGFCWNNADLVWLEHHSLWLLDFANSITVVF